MNTNITLLKRRELKKAIIIWIEVIGKEVLEF